MILKETGDLVFEFEKIVKRFPKITKQWLINNPISASNLFVEKYFYKQSNYNQKIEYYLPIKNNDKIWITIFSKYLESNDNDTNILEIISAFNNAKDFFIPEKIKIKAQKKIEQINSEFFEYNNNFTITTNIIYKNDLKSLKEFKKDNYEFTYYFNLNWLNRNLDYPTILNNFIYMFEVIDERQGLMTLSFKNKRMGIIDCIYTEKKDFYKTDYFFESKFQLQISLFYMYYDFLKEKNIYLEEVINYFFNEYLKTEFNLINFIHNIPSKNTTYLEKIRLYAPEIESVLNQYNSFCNEGFIDHNLIQNTLGHFRISSIKSLVSKKYIYPVEKETNKILYHLFSNQSPLSYNINYEGGPDCECFYDLIIKYNITKKDYPEHYINIIDFLLEKKIITEYKGFLKISYITNSLKLIYEYDCINQYNCIDYYFNENEKKYKIKKSSLSYIAAINYLENNGFIKFDESGCLFSKNEQDLIDYILNNKKFLNSLSIRNKYLHSSPNNLNEESHKYNYMILLYLMICIVLKINDDLCENHFLKNNITTEK